MPLIEFRVGIIGFAMGSASPAGSVNAVALQAPTNDEFTLPLGRVLGRPPFLPIPPFALRLAFGEGANEKLLAAQRGVSERLQAADYE